uniref:Reverse transcriptase Ty1/copia-type domain-containing protein n=1 Tax=Lactuca sativa TaxID=4236 RepID=A0A9R1WWA2_LACSA|nr:hypothetical protein LSAT_V11C800414640 [Lactuca sativa]
MNHSWILKVAIMTIYVENIILTRNYIKEINELKQVLGKAFEIKDLGQLRYFLGMEIARSRKGISVTQRKYKLDLLKKTGLLGCKPASILMEPGRKFQTENGDEFEDK